MADDSSSVETAELSKPIFKDGRYDNPWSTWFWPPTRKMLRWFLLDKNLSSVPSQSILDTSLPVVIPNKDELNTPPASGIRLLWIGHASTLVQFDGITLLTDPVFSSRCGIKSKFGPLRYRPCPVSVDELPNVDAVLISHNHYDHLDEKTVTDLNKRFGDKLKWFVPLGNKDWLNAAGCANVEELTWWQQSRLSIPGKGDILFACTPCQHWSNRKLYDKCKSLWSSWVVKGPTQSFFFGGDTGYCPAFKEIGKRYGPFNLAAIPIGAYFPRDCLQCQHVNPSEAVDVHCDVRAKRSVGIHWGTFALSYEHYLEPPLKLKEALKIKGLSGEDFFTLKHGEVRTFDDVTEDD